MVPRCMTVVEFVALDGRQDRAAKVRRSSGCPDIEHRIRLAGGQHAGSRHGRTSQDHTLCGTSRAVDRCTRRDQPKAGRDRPLHVGALGTPDGLEALKGLALVFKPEE